jgi:hypothetical protein
MNDYLEKGPTDCWIWQKEPAEAPNAKAKMACENPMCCNPRHVVEIAQEEDMIDELRERAKGMGIKVDKRWGADRLIEEMQKVE